MIPLVEFLLIQKLKIIYQTAREAFIAECGCCDLRMRSNDSLRVALLNLQRLYATFLPQSSDGKPIRFAWEKNKILGAFLNEI